MVLFNAFSSEDGPAGQHKLWNADRDDVVPARDGVHIFFISNPDFGLRAGVAKDFQNFSPKVAYEF